MEYVQFVIPDKKEQLLESNGDNKVFVEGVYPYIDLPIEEQKLFIAELYNRLIVPMDNTIPIIDERETLSKLYSLVDVVGQMNTSSKREVINLLADGMYFN